MPQFSMFYLAHVGDQQKVGHNDHGTKFKSAYFQVIKKGPQ
jgi:hypothetical protein